MAIPPSESVLGHGVTIVYRRGSSRKAEKAYGELREKFGSRTDITLVKGDQPVYYFILSVE